MALFLFQIDSIYPTFTYDLVNEILKMHNRSANLQEMILRSEKFLTSDGKSRAEADQ